MKCNDPDDLKTSCSTRPLLRRPMTMHLLLFVTSSVTFFPLWHVATTAHAFAPTSHLVRRKGFRLENEYDDWRSDAIPLSLPLDENNVLLCLSLFVESEYGKQMFGCHERASDIGITGKLEFVELAGPEVTLSLSGSFWHRRATVLGRAATWLNACMPEIAEVNVADMQDLLDFDEIKDDITGEVVFVTDKRAADFNGDRGTMEYQGMDPDMRGPFAKI